MLTQSPHNSKETNPPHPKTKNKNLIPFSHKALNPPSPLHNLSKNLKTPEKKFKRMANNKIPIS
jgi:hypothetical protein